MYADLNPHSTLNSSFFWRLFEALVSGLSDQPRSSAFSSHLGTKLFSDEYFHLISFSSRGEEINISPFFQVVSAELTLFRKPNGILNTVRTG